VVKGPTAVSAPSRKTKERLSRWSIGIPAASIGIGAAA
jgi:hypothetical protein